MCFLASKITKQGVYKFRGYSSASFLPDDSAGRNEEIDALMRLLSALGIVIFKTSSEKPELMGMSDRIVVRRTVWRANLPRIGLEQLRLAIHVG